MSLFIERREKKVTCSCHQNNIQMSYIFTYSYIALYRIEEQISIFTVKDER